ncbi:MAG: hypothetical protein ACKOCB_00170, partial [Planctomycetia bacterium]
SAWTGFLMPGYTDRNRDHGFMVHGTLGCNSEWSYMVAVTNGDGGDSIRNVWDPRTDDNLAYSARLNWAFLKPTFYEEGALRQSTCEWYGEAGAWAHAHDNRVDGPHAEVYDLVMWGVDIALGYGGFSMTAACTIGALDLPGSELDTTALLLQAGWLFPGTAWEVAARWSRLRAEVLDDEADMTELAGVVNYYLNGHANKLSVDITALASGSEGVVGLVGIYPGLRSPGTDEDELLFRFQWQLAL